mmetsp:Transcript_28896/g.88604  ORF Transcript_28896/g.88604 Transcript_28896/m.88604 type:complete len:95 (-) Transcript_28896:3014-3298(-)
MKSALRPTAAPVRHPHFVVFKGYHVGSLWLSDAFDMIPGCALFFEYEHCARPCQHDLLPPSRDNAAVPAAWLRMWPRQGDADCGRHSSEMSRVS